MSRRPHQTIHQTPSSPDSPVGKNANAVVALGALYQGEKTDIAYVNATAMAMMGVGAGYLVGAVPLVEKLSQVPVEPLAWLFLLLLPTPLWLVAIFQSLLTLNTISHSISIQIIEVALFDASKLRVTRTLVGSAASERIMDVGQAKAAHRVATYVVYGGVFVCQLLFTGYALYSANIVIPHPDHLAAPAVWIALGGYSILLVVVAFSWLVGLRMMDDSRTEMLKTR